MIHNDLLTLKSIVFEVCRISVHYNMLPWGVLQHGTDTRMSLANLEKMSDGDKLALLMKGVSNLFTKSYQVFVTLYCYCRWRLIILLAALRSMLLHS